MAGVAILAPPQGCDHVIDSWEHGVGYREVGQEGARKVKMFLIKNSVEFLNILVSLMSLDLDLGS